jgi:predicted dienelactone hydrolase
MESCGMMLCLMYQIAFAYDLDHDQGRSALAFRARVKLPTTQELNMTITNTMRAAAFLLTFGTAHAGEVGVMNFTFDAPQRERLVQALVWYPAIKSVKMAHIEYVGDNAVFKGTLANRDALPDGVKHPLIIFSHGSGGNAAGLGWISERLAAEGYVVIVANHQGSTSGDSTPETNVKIWQPPQDVSAMLDAVSASSALQRIVDVNNVTAIGFSMGGHTVLALAGATAKVDAFAKFCDDHKDSPNCIWFDHGNDLIKGHVDLHKLDPILFEQNLSDKRIGRVAAIDPGVAQALDTKSLMGISVPTLLINLGQGEAIPLGVLANQIAKSIPHAQYETVEGANHFSFLAECKALGWAYIMMEGDDPVCTESNARSRAELHEEIASKIVTWLNGTKSN